jgi:hypothetical protein
MGGARSLRFPFNASDAYMDNVLANTDGMFFIGGGESLPASAKYAYSVISGLQDAGLPYAMWGTCNGFQWLTELMAGHEKPNDILGSGYDAEELNLALNFTGDANESRLFNPISDYYEGIDLIGLLTDNAVTLNLHTCVRASEASAKRPRPPRLRQKRGSTWGAGSWARWFCAKKTARRLWKRATERAVGGSPP